MTWLHPDVVCLVEATISVWVAVASASAVCAVCAVSVSRVCAVASTVAVCEWSCAKLDCQLTLLLVELLLLGDSIINSLLLSLNELLVLLLLSLHQLLGAVLSLLESLLLSLADLLDLLKAWAVWAVAVWQASAICTVA